MITRRVTVFAGHYGSGKTNAAINYALFRARRGEKTLLADLDVVNPYFRSKDGARILKEAGIRLVASPYAGSNVDVPALPAEAYAVTDERDACAVVDVGGDDRGALAMGRFVPALREENNYAALFVVNARRPLTSTPQAAYEALREIEAALGLPFSGIVNNANLGEETTEEVVLEGLSLAEKLSGRCGIPVVMTTALSRLCGALRTRGVQDLFPMELYVRQSWLSDPDAAGGAT